MFKSYPSLIRCSSNPVCRMCVEGKNRMLSTEKENVANVIPCSSLVLWILIIFPSIPAYWESYSANTPIKQSNDEVYQVFAIMLFRFLERNGSESSSSSCPLGVELEVLVPGLITACRFLIPACKWLLLSLCSNYFQTHKVPSLSSYS